MAASILQRFLLPFRTSAKCASHRLNGRRCLLSAAYTDTSIWEQREKDPQNLAALASLMDKTYEKKFPVSSLTISRFVDNISSREEIDQAEYYMYKFRHSPNCWYLRDWTIHSWFRQCLKYGARDKALYTLKNKVQFGMFPDEFTFNILIDSYLKDEDYTGAFSVVEEIMLQEAFDLPTTQIITLYALSKYLATKPELNWQQERNIGTALMLAGLKQKNSAGLSAQLLGYALIGKVEITRGIHAVFHNMPLMWTPGYLNRSLAIMETVCSEAGHVKLSKDVNRNLSVLINLHRSARPTKITERLNYVQKILRDLSSVIGSEAAMENVTEIQTVNMDEEDELERAKLPQYEERFMELNEKLHSQGKVEVQALDTLSSILAKEKLRAFEELDVAQYKQKVQNWEVERKQLFHRENALKNKVKQEHLATKNTQMLQ